MRAIPKPVIGYWGSLEVLQDQELVAFMAERHPEWSFVFIGKPLYDFRLLKRYPNVHFLGFIPLEGIPAYAVHFDVAMINWKQNEWVRHTCPVKYREYLALGKPVVSVDIIEVERALPSDARIARTREEFCRAVEEALATDTPERARRRRDLVAHETWEYSSGKVLEVLQDLERADG